MEEESRRGVEGIPQELWYRALNAPSSSKGWEHSDTPLFLCPWGTPPEAPAPFNGQHRTRVSAGPD